MSKVSNEIFKTRSKIYDNIRNNSSKLDVDKGILLKFKLKKKDIIVIENQIKKIILKSLKIYHNKPFKDKKNLISFYEKDIFSLPNITPNGELKPIKEIIKEYNQLHLIIVRLLNKLNLLKYIAKASLINIRIKKGGKNNFIDKRDYSTTKVHSDSWNGEVIDSKLMLMVLGDMNKNYVQFFKPINCKKNILKKLKNFDKGSNYYEKLINLGHIKKNQLVIFDLLCLHKTYIATKKSRVSLDLGVDWKKIIKEDYFDRSSKRYKYYNLKQWSNFDYSKIKEFNMTFSEVQKKFKNLFSQN